eukprot:GHVU01096131.1.p1 GENE.GHVU01096131.1~~GHVU01096131.1.p1  ORF type:complete len:297 (+),score=20.10 GHVU01096131.1:90-980(+)
MGFSCHCGFSPIVFFVLVIVFQASLVDSRFFPFFGRSTPPSSKSSDANDPNSPDFTHRFCLESFPTKVTGLDGKSYTFDFGPLRREASSWRPTPANDLVCESSKYSYYLNLCAETRRQCDGKRGFAQQFEHQIYSKVLSGVQRIKCIATISRGDGGDLFANTARFQLIDAYNGNTGVRLLTTDGDVCETTGEFRTLDLFLVCDPELGADATKFEYCEETMPCQYNFRVRSKHACPTSIKGPGDEAVPVEPPSSSQVAGSRKSASSFISSASKMKVPTAVLASPAIMPLAILLCVSQ